MKRRFSLLLAVILVLHLSACGANGQDEPIVSNVTAGRKDNTVPTEESNAENETKSEYSGSNILIAYFSVPEDVETDGVDAVAGASIVVKDGEKLGNTEYVAKLIQQTTGGDLFRIETVEPYPLEHDPLLDQAADEQDDDLRPELAAHVEDFEKYEYVFLGYAGGIIGLN